MNSLTGLSKSLPAFLLLLTCAAGAASSPQINLCRVPDGGLQPQAIVDSTGTVHLVYLAGDPKHSDVLYTRRPAGQTNFSKAIRVNCVPGSAIAVGTVRGAKLALVSPAEPPRAVIGHPPPSAFTAIGLKAWRGEWNGCVRRPV